MQPEEPLRADYQVRRAALPQADFALELRTPICAQRARLVVFAIGSARHAVENVVRAEVYHRGTHLERSSTYRFRCCAVHRERGLRVRLGVIYSRVCGRVDNQLRSVRPNRFAKGVVIPHV